MARIERIHCDICGEEIAEGIYAIRLEFRRKRAPVQSREYPEVCHDCGWQVQNRILKVIADVAAARRPKEPPPGEG